MMEVDGLMNAFGAVKMPHMVPVLENNFISIDDNLLDVLSIDPDQNQSKPMNHWLRQDSETNEDGEVEALSDEELIAFM